MAVEFWRSEWLSELRFLRHGVTCRSGGVSKGSFDSLNLGLHVGDAAEAVWENRRRTAEAMGFSRDLLVCTEQVHGGVTCRVGAADCGRGARDYGDAIPGTDALMTNERGVLLMLLYADCVPLLLADPVQRAVAIVHAGWRGIMADVAENTLAAMRREFGTDAADVVAAIGPGIGSCCFAVGADVADAFLARVQTVRDGQRFVDLAAALQLRLESAGVRADKIDACGECTSCLPERYFSHRRDKGRTGRVGALIGLPSIIVEETI